MDRQNRRWRTPLILGMICLCVASGCGASKTELPGIKMESGASGAEPGTADAGTPPADRKDPADELVPQALLDTLDGWYVCSTGTSAHKYHPIKDLLFDNSQNDLTFGDLWEWDEYQYEEGWNNSLYITYDETQTSPIVFPALLKELKMLESLGITTKVDEVDPELVNCSNPDEDVSSESETPRRTEVDWSNLESMTWLLSLNIDSDDMGSEKEELFECVKKLKNLKILSFYDTTMTSLPDVFAPLTQLERLEIFDTSIVEWPASFYQLKNLKELYLDHSDNLQLDVKQIEQGGWKHLRRLSMYSPLPEGDYDFPDLEYLEFASDADGNLPEVVGRFEQLNVLMIHGPINEIPENYKNLIHLTRVHLFWEAEGNFDEVLETRLVESIQKERASRGLPPSEID